MAWVPITSTHSTRFSYFVAKSIGVLCAKIITIKFPFRMGPAEALLPWPSYSEVVSVQQWDVMYLGMTTMHVVKQISWQKK